MEHILPPLPFKENELEPYMSKETIEYHYGRHHKAYVDSLNKLIPNSQFVGKSLEYVIKNSTGGIFNNAAQLWNHTFFWKCLSPKNEGKPSGILEEFINKQWSNFDMFKEKFRTAALTNFGSGWTWLVKNQNGELSIINTANAQTPLTTCDIPLLTVDVWEHAYYIDHRNARANFLDAFWHIVNWKFVEQNFA